MNITAQRCLTELGNKPWSGFNSDDMIFSSEDSIQVRTELNSALRYLINLKDFPFRSKEQDLMAMRNVQAYTMPEGQITTIYNADTRDTLTFISDESAYDKTAKGQPTGYWINHQNPTQEIRLYPIPDTKYNYKVIFNQYKPIMDNEGNTKFEFENEDDFINMPDNIAPLFMDCLTLRTMATNIKDDQDENYAPILKEFDEVWKVFTKACKPVNVENRMVW